VIVSVFCAGAVAPHDTLPKSMPFVENDAFCGPVGTNASPSA
jgi:hypothetical protein